MRVLIVGSTLDDISYIQTKMDVQEVITVAGDTEIYLGTYAKKNIALVATGIGNYVSSMITALAIELTKPYLCIQIGNVNSFDETLKQTDLFVATRVYLSDINQMPIGKLTYGQLPGLKPFYTSEVTLVQRIKDINSSLANKPLLRGVLLTDNKFRTVQEDMNKIIDKHFVKIENMDACDSNAGGIVIACEKYKIPYVSLLVCAYELGDEKQLLTRQRKGLSVQPYVGKIIAQLIDNDSE